MTLQKLSQIYKLKKEIAEDKERIKRLRAMAYEAGTPSLNGMPSVHTECSSVEHYVIIIEDVEQQIADKLAKYAEAVADAVRFIDGIDDSLTRRIFKCRFIDGMSWAKIGTKLCMSDSGCKNICYRYLNNQ